jgi:N6-L-threonylcarbamoyladenine synthase
VVGGGVAANSALRSALARETEELGVELRVPPVRLCTDNATMIAWVGRKRLLAGENDPLTLPADPNLDLVPAPR